MQTIPTEYRQAGHIMQLVKRDGNAVMFKALGDDYWEVHRVKVAPADRDAQPGRLHAHRQVAVMDRDRQQARLSVTVRPGLLFRYEFSLSKRYVVRHAP